MLQGRTMHPTIPATDLERARAWYEDKLGLTPAREQPGGLTYEAGDGSFFLLFPSTGAGTARHTVAGWVVDDLEALVAELRDRGVAFESYDTPQLKTVDGVASTPGGKAAWFKDSEGNLLGFIQFQGEPEELPDQADQGEQQD